MSPKSHILTFKPLLQTLPLQQNPSCVPNQATASDLPFYDIVVPKKVPHFKNVWRRHCMWFGPPQSKILARLWWHRPLSPRPDGTIVILSDYADMLWRCEYQYALAPQCPAVTVRTFPHLDFTDRYTVTIMSLWRTQIKLVQYIGKVIYILVLW